MTVKALTGKVALVTGATRGLGKGIAIGLGEAGATVYITGRSLEEPINAAEGVSGSLRETQAAVEQAGGVCFPVQTDHQDDEQVRSLFDRIQTEQNGQLDILVNNVYGGVTALGDQQGEPFWKAEPSLWDACNNVGLRSHYVASVLAARMMVPCQQGLICTISSWGGLAPIFGVAYGVGKSACDRLAADMAVDLKPYNIASLSLWPGIVGTEHISRLLGVDEDQSEANQSGADPQWQLMRDRYNWETPLLTGRVIAAIAADPAVMRRTGRVQIVAELADQYGVSEADGTRPVSLRSLRFLLPYRYPALRSYSHLIPNIRIPWALLLLYALNSPKV